MTKRRPLLKHSKLNTARDIRKQLVKSLLEAEKKERYLKTVHTYEPGILLCTGTAWTGICQMVQKTGTLHH